MTEISKDPLVNDGQIPLPKTFSHDPQNNDEDYDPNDKRRMHDFDIDNFKTDEDINKMIRGTVPKKIEASKDTIGIDPDTIINREADEREKIEAKEYFDSKNRPSTNLD